MSERVRGEDLVAQHDEVADQAGGERDAAAGDEGVAHEVEREHVLWACEKHQTVFTLLPALTVR